MGRFLISSLQKRAASALVLVPFTLAIIYYGGWPFVIFLILLAGLSLFEWLHTALKTSYPVSFSVLGLIYIPVSIGCCFLIREDFHVFFALLFIVMIWASDIGAYAVGKTLKGPKMASEISPNKTWSGYVGALLFPGLVPVLALGFYAAITGGIGVFNVGHVLNLFVVGAIIGLVGQSGDLCVSFLKRKASVKDTGSLIPGHGGILDRIDSMLLAAPVFLFLIKEFTNGIWH